MLQYAGRAARRAFAAGTATIAIDCVMRRASSSGSWARGAEAGGGVDGSAVTPAVGPEEPGPTNSSVFFPVEAVSA